MKSTWFQCDGCWALWFFQFEPGEAPLRFCTDCGSELVEVMHSGASGPAGGGQVWSGYDPDREVIGMIRQTFGPEVTEIDPMERWAPAGTPG
jgi:hypothetical protein